MSEPLRLRTALGKHHHVEPLRDGRVVSSRLVLDFVEFDPLPNAFRQMVRGEALDVSELAVATHFLAHHANCGLTGIAIPLWSRLPHTNLICCDDQGIERPTDLQDRLVGMRSYCQTSGVWVRGILSSEYAVDLSRITWGTMEDAHVASYVDPPSCRRYIAPPNLRDLMMTGAFAAIMGERVVDPQGIRTVIPDAEQAARDWIERTGMTPINHILAVRQDLVDAHPWLAQELMTMFERARELSSAEGADSPPAYGLEVNRRSLQLFVQFAAEQGVIPRAYDVDEMFQNI